ncbi:MAG: GTPase Era [Chitinophagaceae bacterium]|nr:GTPase Era [Chitinophagaceae bacterium]
MDSQQFKSGFVSFIGKPNAGKSTLMNILVGEKISIVTPKAQTTRHRILGISNTADYQIVYSDTPGIIQPVYSLQKSMMKFVDTAISDSDILVFLMDINEIDDAQNKEILERLKKHKTPVFIVLNKIDICSDNGLQEKVKLLIEDVGSFPIVPVSALKNKNVNVLLEMILQHLPEHPPYFLEDELTDKTERFLCADIIREKIFLIYEKEVPYCCEVFINSYQDHESIVKIEAYIYVERESQKGILIGNRGVRLRNLGIQARKDIEFFLKKHVFLSTIVKVEKNWRKSEKLLRRFGYGGRE